MMDADDTNLSLTAHLNARIALTAMGAGKATWVKRSTTFNRRLRAQARGQMRPLPSDA